jgi:hypothetical protein
MKAPDHLKKNIFEAPDGYFDALPDRLQERIRKEEAGAKVVGIPRWAYAVAASLLILLVAGVFFFQQPEAELASEQQIEALLAEVPQEVMLDYLQTDTDLNLTNVNLTDEEQEELLLQGLDTYELPIDDYEYEIYELEEYL